MVPGLNVPKQREPLAPHEIDELDPGALPVTVPLPVAPTVTV